MGVRGVARELYANMHKCGFAKTKVEYLGHIILGKGVEVDPRKLDLSKMARAH